MPPIYVMNYDYNEDRCNICGERYSTDVDPFEMGPGRYKAYCACTAKLEQEEADRAKGSYKDYSYSQTTLGDLLKLKLEKK